MCAHTHILDVEADERYGSADTMCVCSNAHTQILDVEADEAFTLPLLHNVSVLVDSATADIQRLTRQSASEKARPLSPHTSLTPAYVVA